MQDSIVGSSTWINTEDFKNGVCKKGNRTIYTELDLSDAAIYNQVGKLLTIPLEKASLCGIFMFINNPLLAESAPAEIEKIQNIPQFLYNSIDNTGFLTFIAKFGSASDGSKGVVFLYNSTPGSASPDQIVKPGYILETTIGINSQFNGVFDYVTITSNAGINIINSVNNYF